MWNLNSVLMTRAGKFRFLHDKTQAWKETRPANNKHWNSEELFKLTTLGNIFGGIRNGKLAVFYDNITSRSRVAISRAISNHHLTTTLPALNTPFYRMKNARIAVPVVCDTQLQFHQALELMVNVADKTWQGWLMTPKSSWILDFFHDDPELLKAADKFRSKRPRGDNEDSFLCDEHFRQSGQKLEEMLTEYFVKKCFPGISDEDLEFMSYGPTYTLEEQDESPAEGEPTYRQAWEARRDEISKLGKEARVHLANRIIAIVKADLKGRLVPPSLILRGRFAKNVLQLRTGIESFDDLTEQLDAIESKRQLIGNKTILTYNTTRALNKKLKYTELIKKLTTSTEAWGTLQFTYPSPIGFAKIDTYTQVVAGIAARITGLVQITEWFQILKRPGFETLWHMDCHRRPQVTCYHVQEGSTTFFLAHPLLGYFARFLDAYSLKNERNGFVHLFQKDAMGTILRLEEDDIAVINPGQAHHVWVGNDETKVTSIVAVEIPLAMFSDPANVYKY